MDAGEGAKAQLSGLSLWSSAARPRPSEICELFPAVTEPPSLKAGCSAARVSSTLRGERLRRHRRRCRQPARPGRSADRTSPRPGQWRPARVMPGRTRRADRGISPSVRRRVPRHALSRMAAGVTAREIQTANGPPNSPPPCSRPSGRETSTRPRRPRRRRSGRTSGRPRRSVRTAAKSRIAGRRWCREPTPAILPTALPSGRCPPTAPPPGRRNPRSRHP